MISLPLARTWSKPDHYRPDIDGLRAIAVLATMVYHAFPAALPGGFCGVDVFFVISGFLITRLLLVELRQGQLHLTDFYARRVKRLFPALLVVLAFLLLVGGLGLLGQDYAQLGQHVAAASAFVSNFLLWSELGYFDHAAISKPLLHCWSLAVEEQFYVLWPLGLWLATRCRVNPVWFIGVTALASFAYCVWPRGADPHAVFYFAHARFWELALGSLLACWTLSARASRVAPASLANTLSVAGLTLLGLAVGLLAHDQNYPGWRTLLPTTAACLIVLAGAAAWPNRVLLANRPLVQLGLISYPLYLWHWSLLSLLHLLAPERQTVGTKGVVLALSVVLAFATWRWVELPLRRGYTRNWKLLFLIVAMALTGSVGWFIFKQDGFPARFPNASANLARDADWDYPGARLQARVVVDVPVYQVGGEGKQTVFFGDSNIEQYGPRIAELLSGHAGQQRGALFLTQGGAIPIDHIRRVDGHLTSSANFFKLLDQANVDRVVIGAAWALYFNADKFDLGLTGFIVPHYFAGEESLEHSTGQQIAAARLQSMVRQLLQRGLKVYLVAGTPGGKEFGRADLASKRQLFTDEPALGNDFVAPSDPSAGVPRERVRQRMALSSEWLRGVAAVTGAEFIDPLPYVCAPTHCAINRFKDAGHLRASFVRQHLHYLDHTVLD